MGQEDKFSLLFCFQFHQNAEGTGPPQQFPIVPSMQYTKCLYKEQTKIQVCYIQKLFICHVYTNFQNNQRDRQYQLLKAFIQLPSLIFLFFPEIEIHI